METVEESDGEIIHWERWIKYWKEGVSYYSAEV